MSREKQFDDVTWSQFFFLTAQYEADNIRKQYVKTLEAYCSLGVLRVKEGSFIFKICSVSLQLV